MNSYLFILCPPYSGSTVLWKLVGTSDAVSSLPSEGQFLPEVKDVMRQAPWNPDVKLPWKRIKDVWDGYWDHDKPLLVEKSPPHIIRTGEILEHFSPVYFLLMVRNPYAHCEGLMRRNQVNAQEAAKFTVRCLRKQAENASRLNNILCFTYEELVASPESISGKIQSSIPQIGDLKPTQSFEVRSIDGVVKRGIVDLNRKKINNLSASDLKEINEVLKSNADVMNHWGYEYYEPSRYHALTYLRTRGGLLVSTTLSKGKRFTARVSRRLINSKNKCQVHQE